MIKERKQEVQLLEALYAVKPSEDLKKDRRILIRRIDTANTRERIQQSLEQLRREVEQLKTNVIAYGSINMKQLDDFLAWSCPIDLFQVQKASENKMLSTGLYAGYTLLQLEILYSYPPQIG